MTQQTEAAPQSSEARFIVTEHKSPALITFFRVYDRFSASYPAIAAFGVQVQDHYSARDHAQRVADQINEADAKVSGS